MDPYFGDQNMGQVKQSSDEDQPTFATFTLTDTTDTPTSSTTSSATATAKPSNSDTSMMDGDSIDAMIDRNSTAVWGQTSNAAYAMALASTQMVLPGVQAGSYPNFHHFHPGFQDMYDPSLMGMGPGGYPVTTDMMASYTSLETSLDVSHLASGVNDIHMLASPLDAPGAPNSMHASVNQYGQSFMSDPLGMPPHSLHGGYRMVSMEDDSAAVAAMANPVGPAPGIIGNVANMAMQTQAMEGVSFQAQLRSASMAERPTQGPTTPVVDSPSAASTSPVSSLAEPPPVKNVYSRSGFDLLRALRYIQDRKGPKIDLGPVDFSCAFVVCDVTQNDCPIIYVSDNFQNLTGYSSHEILGKNCRFLQAPDGLVEPGSKRQYVDDSAVLRLKDRIEKAQEVQQSLLNFRKGGKSFLNLLTMIPIPWDEPKVIRYFVGFQIELDDTTAVVEDRKVDYTRSGMVPFYWAGPQTNHMDRTVRALSHTEISELLRTYPSVVKRQHWDIMLLENSDDVVCIVSVQGVIHYVSPSCKISLEYDPAELLGKNLSLFCHAADWTTVHRELKDAKTDNDFDIIFRHQMKRGGFVWWQTHGSVQMEQGKPRKYIVLVGRKLPVFSLSRNLLAQNGGVGDGELWNKLSTSGMFLFVSNGIRKLTEYEPINWIGRNMHEMMRKTSRADFGRALELARKGSVVTCRHEICNRRGIFVQAQTTLYPGDDLASGSRPTYLLAQTRFAMSPRGNSVAAALSPPPMAAGPPLLGYQHSSAVSIIARGPRAALPSNVIAAPALLSPQMSAAEQLKMVQERKDEVFEELEVTRTTSWHYELHVMEKDNRVLTEELHMLITKRKKRKRRRAAGGGLPIDCANCHRTDTPEWRKGPSGKRDLCNSCGLKYAKETGRISPRGSNKSKSVASVDNVIANANATAAATTATEDGGTSPVIKQSASPPSMLSGSTQLPYETAEPSNRTGSEARGNNPGTALSEVAEDEEDSTLTDTA